LDTSLTLRDEGVSAFTGKHRENPDEYALATFLGLVKSGRVRPGSYLIVESLDRLSREDVDEGLELLLGLTRAGIRVVQLQPTEIVYAKPVDPMKLVITPRRPSPGRCEHDPRAAVNTLRGVEGIRPAIGIPITTGIPLLGR
jgi:hypothetical protein